EVDRRLAKILEQTVGKTKNVEVVREDILTYDLRHAGKSGPIFVVGNIPYRITAPILKYLVENRGSICGALLLTQREVAEKVTASPGRNGSALGVFLQAYADIHVIRRVSRGSFHPVPEVDSTLWSLSFLRQPRFTADKEEFFTVVRALYGKRRKMIRSALRDLLAVEQVAEILGTAGIDPTVRGETLSLEEIDRIAQLLPR
ncbi:MAG: rRNA adenine dimethyltransferase family protein, partial [Candidatus Bipolaricaulota bacterium]|nr:rRNA adenine dimethyltransferase family protein [Candidatus Bipolaricaulota bacterium]